MILVQKKLRTSYHHTAVMRILNDHIAGRHTRAGVKRMVGYTSSKKFEVRFTRSWFSRNEPAYIMGLVEEEENGSLITLKAWSDPFATFVLLAFAAVMEGFILWISGRSLSPKK